MEGTGNPSLMNMKKLIVNADDFGLTEGVNRAIIEGHLHGIVTSAALMVNMWAFEQAVELAKQYPPLGVGIHLTLAVGIPVLEPEQVPSLVNDIGYFWKRSELIRRLFLNKISLAEVESELTAQVEKFLNSGLKPTHLNSDQHFHVLPGICEIVVKLAKELEVPLRIPDERLIWNGHSKAFRSLRLVTPILIKTPMKMMCKRVRYLCDKYSVRTNDYFLSPFGLIPWEKPQPKHFKLLLSLMEDGVTELMVHPGYCDRLLSEFWIGGEQQAKEREEELKCLLDTEIKAMVNEQSILLINYASL